MERASRTHCIVSLLLLAACGLLCAGLDAAAHSARVARALDDRSEALYAREDRVFVHLRNYGDVFETLMLDELRKADYSRGGAYVLGSSNALFCAEFADLPAAARKLVHNYAFPGANPTEIRQFIDYLADQRGLLRAGGDKTSVLICLNHTDLMESTDQFVGAGEYFPSYLNGSGLFNYDPAHGIADLSMPAWERSIKIRRTQWRSFAHRLELATQSVMHYHLDPAAQRKLEERSSAGGQSVNNSPQWAELERLLDDLKARRVNVTLLIMPTGSWFRGLPPQEQFLKRFRRLVAARQIPLIDCSTLLSDGEFMDQRHPDLVGAKKVHDILLQWAFDQLDHTGALPSPQRSHAP